MTQRTDLSAIIALLLSNQLKSQRDRCNVHLFAERPSHTKEKTRENKETLQNC